MEPIRNISIRWVHQTFGDTSQEATSYFSRFVRGKWQPAINAFRCETGMKICVDLAGVERSLIDLTVEPRRVLLRGTREVPEPPRGAEALLQVLALEIDYGPFEREVRLPLEVDVEQSSAEQQNGLLWIHLPFKQ